MQDTENDFDDLTNEAILRAIASIDKITEELEEYQYEDVAPLEYDESFEDTTDDVDYNKSLGATTDDEKIRKTLDAVNKNEESIFYDINSLPVMVDYDESFDAGSTDSLSKIQNEDPGHFVDPFQEGTSPVEVYPLEVEQVTFNKTKSSKKSSPGTVGLSVEFNALEVHPQSEGAAGDTHWQGRGDASPRGAAFLEDPGAHNEAALGDYKKDQTEKQNRTSPTTGTLTPDLLLEDCDDIMDSGLKRRTPREERLAFSTLNEIGINTSPNPADKDSSSSSGFSEGACALDGSVLVPSNVRTVHTLSESHVKTPSPSTPPPATFSLEPDDSPDNSRELNSSCNSNSPEKIFPLQMASANTDLLSASASANIPTNNDANSSTNANNINRNNNVLMVSKSDGSLATPPPSDIPAVGSFSSNSFHSTTTDSTMYSAQDTLSFNTVVDSDDECQNDLSEFPDFDSPIVDVVADDQFTDTTTF